MKRLLSIILIVLVAVAALAVVLWMVGVADVDIMLYVAYAYLAAAALLAIVMTAMNMGKSQSKSRTGLWVFGGLVLVAIVLYFVASKATPITLADGSVFSNVFTLKISDTMLYAAYVAFGVAILAMIGGEIRKALK